MKKDLIYLPGTDKQINLFAQHSGFEGGSVLIAGSGTEAIAKYLAENYNSPVIIIVDNNESLLSTRLKLSGSGISVRMMDFDNTDFQDARFDLVYAQGSTSVKKRNRIIKEFQRILKPGGILCIGEIVSFTPDPPVFVKDIWENSKLQPLPDSGIAEYYTSRKFELLFEKDLSSSLTEFYDISGHLLKTEINKLSETEKVYYKKFLKQVSHESNAYLNMGAREHYGYKMLILKSI